MYGLKELLKTSYSNANRAISAPKTDWKAQIGGDIIPNWKGVVSGYSTYGSNQ